MTPPLPQFGLSEGQLWRHSVAAALAADESQNYTQKSLPSECFTAGLLHDFGKLLLARHLSPDVQKILAHAKSYLKLPDYKAETELLGVHHGEVGALVTQSWEFPSIISNGVTFHHNPQNAPTEEAKTIAFVTNLADHTAKKIGETLGDEILISDQLEESFSFLEIPPDSFDDFCETVSTKLEEVLLWFSQ